MRHWCARIGLGVGKRGVSRLCRVCAHDIGVICASIRLEAQEWYTHRARWPYARHIRPYSCPRSRAISCDLRQDRTRPRARRRANLPSLRSSSPMVTLSLGLEPGGCTNEAYIVRLDSMEPGNGVCCGATRVFGAYVTDFLLILCAPKRLYIPSGLNEQRIDKRLR